MKIVKFLNSVVINKNGGFGGGQSDHLKGFRFQRKPFAKAKCFCPKPPFRSSA